MGQAVENLVAPSKSGGCWAEEFNGAGKCSFTALQRANNMPWKWWITETRKAKSRRVAQSTHGEDILSFRIAAAWCVACALDFSGQVSWAQVRCAEGDFIWNERKSGRRDEQMKDDATAPVTVEVGIDRRGRERDASSDVMLGANVAGAKSEPGRPLRPREETGSTAWKILGRFSYFSAISPFPCPVKNALSSLTCLGRCNSRITIWNLLIVVKVSPFGVIGFLTAASRTPEDELLLPSASISLSPKKLSLKLQSISMSKKGNFS